MIEITKPVTEQGEICIDCLDPIGEKDSIDTVAGKICKPCAEDTVTCDNTDHETNVGILKEYPDVDNKVKLRSEFGGEVVTWCEMCQVVDKDMIDEVIDDE